MSTRDGGPAFPEIQTGLMYDRELDESLPNIFSVGGMTLRDYFAGQALAGLATLATKIGDPQKFAADAYTLADALLAEREKEVTHG